MLSIEHLFASSIGLALFVIALIVGKKKKALADGVLFLWLLVFTFNFIALFLLSGGPRQFMLWEHIIFEFSEASIFLHGPLLYFYTLTLTRISFNFQAKHLLHVAPFVVAFCILIGRLFWDKTEDSSMRNILLVGKMLSLFLYIVLTLKLLKVHKQRITDIFSNTEKKYLTWLLIISWGILIIWGISVISLLVHRFTTLEVPQDGGLLTNIAFSIFFFVLGYFGIRQPAIFLETLELRKTRSSEDGLEGITKPKKYEKSGLSEEGAKQAYKRLMEVMVKEKPFLDPELTLYALSNTLNVQPNHLSQIINIIEKMNFFDFINRYRIEEVKKNMFLQQKEHLTILGIAYESGFNSKTSFNRIFKKTTGMTPTEFKKGGLPNTPK